MRRQSRRSYRGTYNPGMTSNLPYVQVPHAEQIHFGLKDLAKTQAKYAKYKNEKWNSIKGDFESYLDELPDIIYRKLKEKESYGALPQDLTNKSSLNQLKTWTNSLTYNANLQEVRGNVDNDNEARSFTVRLYLDNYDRINNAMKEAYMRYVREKM